MRLHTYSLGGTCVDTFLAMAYARLLAIGFEKWYAADFSRLMKNSGVGTLLKKISPKYYQTNKEVETPKKH